MIMSQNHSLNLTISSNKKTGKAEIFILKKLTDEREIKILCDILLENGKIDLPLIISDKIQFYSKLKEKKII